MLPRCAGLARGLSAARTGLALPVRRGLSAAAAAAPPASARLPAPRSKFTGNERVARWSFRLAHDNTFLSYTRNAIISTVAGTAMFQFRKEEGRPPLAAAGLLTMGGLFMYIGSGLYVWQILRLRSDLGIGPWAVRWAIFNATWPAGLWSLSLLCLMDETPSWLLNGLVRVEHLLPAALRSSFFLPVRSLVPIVRLLDRAIEYEEMRLKMYQPTGLVLSPSSSSSAFASRVVRRTTNGTMLTNLDYYNVISLRLERLHALRAKLAPLIAGESRVTPTARVMPTVDLLATTVSQLDSALEADLQRTTGGTWRIVLGTFSRMGWTVCPREQLLLAELDAVRMLHRRCHAVKCDSEMIDS